MYSIINYVKWQDAFSINSSNIYSYYVEVDSEFSGNDKAFKAKTISGEEKDVIIVEEENCTKPRLVEYYKDSNATLWSFGISAGKTYYVFYVPKETIAREIQLN